MQFDTHETDLYVLPETDQERNKVKDFLKSKGIGFTSSVANVKGNSWYGKTFIDIPFCKHLKSEIENL